VIERSDWQAAAGELSAEGLLPEEPSDEDLLAYARGELAPEQSARVEAALASHPELLQALSEPFPLAPQPGDPPPLTPQEQQEDWEKIQARLHRAAAAQPAPAPRPAAPAVPAASPGEIPVTPVAPASREVHAPPSSPLPFPPPREPERVESAWKLAAAASIAAALFLGGLYLQARSEAGRLALELGSPRALDHRTLLPDGLLGGRQRPIPLPARREGLLLAMSLIGQADYPSYRLEIVRGTGAAGRTIWKTSGLERQSNGAVEIWLPTGFLGAGPYQLRLFGAGARGESLLATYTVQLAD